ncbi:MAG: Sjogren's syndrome/scleroderma autoantigen 1 family protein [Methanocella sp.]
MEDKDLQLVTKMLERGGTMLAKHCECGAPLFKYRGKVVCPVCEGKKERQAEEHTELAVPVETRPAISQQAVAPVKKERIAELPSDRQVSVVVGDSTLNEPAIEAVVVAKINEISTRMANEMYPERIKMYMEILETSLRVLRELRSVSR